MRDRAYVGEFKGMWMAHETDQPTRDAFPNGWGGIGGGCSRLGLATVVVSMVLSY